MQRYIINVISFFVLIITFLFGCIAWFIVYLFYPFKNELISNDNNNNKMNAKKLCKKKQIKKEKKIIAVIGAGPTGLTTAKALLESGNDVVIFEKSNKIGGSFNSYSGHLTSSSYVTQFSDFPITNQDLNDSNTINNINNGLYLKFSEFIRYLDRYSKHFGVFKCIKFNNSVVNIELIEEKTKCLFTINNTLNKKEYYVFDHFVVCTGIANAPRYPSIFDKYFNNKEQYPFKVIHSSQFNHEVEIPKNKRILLIGLGESGSDMCYSVAKNCNPKLCVISSRKGPGFLIPRWFRGYPSDIDTSRMHHGLRHWLTTNINSSNNWFRMKLWNLKILLEFVYITPFDDLNVLKMADEINEKSGILWLNHFGTKNLSYIRGMLYHKLEYKPDIVDIHKNGSVQFINGETLVFDYIICCTGFKQNISYLKNLNMKNIKANNLYHHMIDPNYGKLFAFNGLNRPFFGSLIPLSEIAAIYYSQLISNKISLPSTTEQIQNKIGEEKAIQVKYFPNDYKTIPTLVDFLETYQMFGKELGCNIDSLQLFRYYPYVWFKVISGPIQSIHWRIFGRNNKLDINIIQKQLKNTQNLPYSALIATLFCYGLAQLQ